MIYTKNIHDSKGKYSNIVSEESKIIPDRKETLYQVYQREKFDRYRWKLISLLNNTMGVLWMILILRCAFFGILITGWVLLDTGIELSNIFSLNDIDDHHDSHLIRIVGQDKILQFNDPFVGYWDDMKVDEIVISNDSATNPISKEDPSDQHKDSDVPTEVSDNEIKIAYGLMFLFVYGDTILDLSRSCLSWLVGSISSNL